MVNCRDSGVGNGMEGFLISQDRMEARKVTLGFACARAGMEWRGGIGYGEVR